MSRGLTDLFADLPYLLGGHLLLSISAVLIGVLISVPFGALATPDMVPEFLKVVLRALVLKSFINSIKVYDYS